jgi:hypothetical protein
METDHIKKDFLGFPATLVLSSSAYGVWDNKNSNIDSIITLASFLKVPTLTHFSLSI